MSIPALSTTLTSALAQTESSESADPEPAPKPSHRKTSSAKAENQLPGLAALETRIVALVAEGCSRPEIEQTLAISTEALKLEFDRLFKKLGVSCDFELLLFSLYHQLTDPSETTAHPSP